MCSVNANRTIVCPSISAHSSSVTSTAYSIARRRQDLGRRLKSEGTEEVHHHAHDQQPRSAASERLENAAHGISQCRRDDEAWDDPPTIGAAMDRVSETFVKRNDFVH